MTKIKSTYKTALLIQPHITMELEEFGWEVIGDNTLPSQLRRLIKENMVLFESEEDSEKYQGGHDLEVIIDFNDNKQIELISFRFYNKVIPKLPEFLESITSEYNLIFFVPSEIKK